MYPAENESVSHPMVKETHLPNCLWMGYFGSREGIPSKLTVNYPPEKQWLDDDISF